MCCLHEDFPWGNPSRHSVGNPRLLPTTPPSAHRQDTSYVLHAYNRSPRENSHLLFALWQPLPDRYKLGRALARPIRRREGDTRAQIQADRLTGQRDLQLLPLSWRGGGGRWMWLGVGYIAQRPLVKPHTNKKLVLQKSDLGAGMVMHSPLLFLQSCAL